MYICASGRDILSTTFLCSSEFLYFSYTFSVLISLASFNKFTSIRFLLAWNENIVNASANIWLVYYATIYFMNRSASKPLILLFLKLIYLILIINKNKFILYFCGFCKEPQYLCNSYNALAWPAMKLVTSCVAINYLSCPFIKLVMHLLVMPSIKNQFDIYLNIYSCNECNFLLNWNENNALSSNPIFIPSYVRWPVITTMVVFTLV